MQNLNTRLVDDNLYVAVPEIKPGHCDGCVAHGKDGKDLCSLLVDDCEGRKIIWAKQSNVTTTPEEPKYTVREVLEATDIVLEREQYGVVTVLWIVDVEKELSKSSNPDYKLYLKLKEQFGE